MNGKNEEAALENARREEQALAILVALASPISNGRSNDRVLAAFLDRVALGGSTDEIRAALRWLEEVGAIRSEAVEGYVVVELTEAGQRVAEGKATIEGVAVPPR